MTLLPLGAKRYALAVSEDNQNNLNLANFHYNEAAKAGFFENGESDRLDRTSGKKRSRDQAFSDIEQNGTLPAVKRARNEENSLSNVLTNISFETQVDRFLQRITSDSKITVNHDHWAISILVQPECEQLGTAIIGHSVVAVIGKDHDQTRPVFWATDFMGDLTKANPFDVLRAAVAVSPGVIRTTDDPIDRTTLLQGSNFGSWAYNAWGLPRETAQLLQQRVNKEKLDPPYYNLFGHNPLSFLCRKNTLNCSGWAVDAVRQCNIDIPGTLLSRLLGISIPGTECALGHQ